MYPKIVWNYVGGECYVTNGVCNGSKTFRKIITWACEGKGKLDCPPDEDTGSERVVQCVWVPIYKKDYKLNIGTQKCEFSLGSTCPDGQKCEAQTPTQ